MLPKLSVFLVACRILSPSWRVLYTNEWKHTDLKLSPGKGSLSQLHHHNMKKHLVIILMK